MNFSLIQRGISETLSRLSPTKSEKYDFHPLTTYKKYDFHPLQWPMQACKFWSHRKCKACFLCCIYTPWIWMDLHLFPNPQSESKVISLLRTRRRNTRWKRNREQRQQILTCERKIRNHDWREEEALLWEDERRK